VWTGEKWRYGTKEDIPGDISINNVKDIGWARLQRYEASEGQKTLGVFLAMDGNRLNTYGKRLSTLQIASERFSCPGMMPPYNAGITHG
jgi:hypothetical protein